jgi:hypothetical protein
VVIKVGTSRYVVRDPNHRVGEFQDTKIFDAKWELLTGFIG